MSDPDRDQIRVERQGAISRIVLDAPHAGNSLTVGMARTLTEQVREDDRSDEVRCMLLTGAGKSFCTGARLGVTNHSPNNSFDVREQPRAYFDLAEALWQLETPLVVAINGSCYGIAIAIALCGDIVLGASGAPVAQLFTERGSVAHAGDPYILGKLIPYRRLMELSMLGRHVTTDDLAAWGVINAVVEPGGLESEAWALAEELAAGPTVALGQTKRIYRRALESDQASTFRDDAATLALVKTTHDHAEGLAAFKQRRDPTYRGC